MKKIALVISLIGLLFPLSTKRASAAKPEPKIDTVHVYQVRGEKKCNFFSSCVEADQDLIVEIEGISYDNDTPFPDGETIGLDFAAVESVCRNTESELYGYWTLTGYESIEVVDGAVKTTIPAKYLHPACSYKIKIILPKNAGDTTNTKRNVMVYPAVGVSLQCSDDETQCKTNLDSVATYELCSQIKKDTDQYKACETCFKSEGIWTAVGCIPSNPESVIKTIITIGLAAGGGIVLIMILVGSFMLSVSQGDPNKTKEAKEIITSAIIGLLFVIFSVTILQFIGVEILHIPGFGES